MSDIYNQTEYSVLMLAVAVMNLSILATRAPAQTIQRLPPIPAIAQLDRLPSLDEESESSGLQLGEDRTIRFAGGSVELRVPPGWWASEIPFGREVRLVIVPERLPNVRRMPIDGMWMTYNAASPSNGENAEALLQELSARMPLVTGSNGQHSRPTPFQFGDWPAAVAEFTSTEPSNSNLAVMGRHVLVNTQWGLFEFHASAPAAIVESRKGIWAATWDSLRLNPPATNALAPSQLNTIIGDWKSYRSRMRFSDDGRVSIIPDALGNNQLSRPLTGTFEARDDLVFVRWDDGSRLNFRWRLQGNDLFLTDHEGQISQLKRVFD